MKLDFDIGTKTPKIDFDMKDTTVVNTGGGISESRVRQIVQEETEGLASEEYADNASNQAVSQGIAAHNVSQEAHKDIRVLITELSNRLNAIADSDDTTLDQLSEIVAYIKANKALIESVTTSKVNVTDIVNDLETNVADKPLSAAQGVALKALINALEQSISAFEENVGMVFEELQTKTNELEEYSIREVSLNLVEDNELSVKLKDKEGNVIASSEIALPISDLSEYVQFTDVVDNLNEKAGLVRLKKYGAGGFQVDGNGYLTTQAASIALKKARDYVRPLVSADIEDILYLGVTGYKEVWVGSQGSYVGSYGNQKALTDEEKGYACDWLGAVTRRPNENNGWNRVYGMSSTGVECVFRVANGTDGGTLAIRGTGGTLIVGIPQTERDATTKKYVDNLPDYLTLTDEEKAKWRGMMGATKWYLHKTMLYIDLENDGGQDELAVTFISPSPSSSAFMEELAIIVNSMTWLEETGQTYFILGRGDDITELFLIETESNNRLVVYIDGVANDTNWEL